MQSHLYKTLGLAVLRIIAQPNIIQVLKLSTTTLSIASAGLRLRFYAHLLSSGISVSDPFSCF